MPTIDDLKSAYEGEWLAVVVTRKDQTGPLEGELIHHSEDESEIWNRIQDDRRLIAVTYAGPLVDEGTAVAL